MIRSPRPSMFVVAVALAACSGDDGYRLSPQAGAGRAPPATAPKGASGTAVVTASGAAAAIGGIPFPQVGEMVFADGWDVRFARILTTLDEVTVSPSPDLSPGDATRTGEVLATLRGPWAVDLHAGGPLAAKSGAGAESVELDKFGGEESSVDFDPTLRYALGFRVVEATADARAVSFDAVAGADYAEMIAAGHTILYVGTATFRGGAGCATTGNYDFGKLPATVDFRLGLRAPATYVNCQNPDSRSATCWGP